MKKEEQGKNKAKGKIKNLGKKEQKHTSGGNNRFGCTKDIPPAPGPNKYEIIK